MTRVCQGHFRVVQAELDLLESRIRRASLTAPIDGTVVGVAIFDHPANPRHPTPWYVSVGQMGFFNPAFLFDQPYTLPAGKSLTLKYRVLIHPGLGRPADLEKQYQAFAK